MIMRAPADGQSRVPIGEVRISGREGLPSPTVIPLEVVVANLREVKGLKGEEKEGKRKSFGGKENLLSFLDESGSWEVRVACTLV